MTHNESAALFHSMFPGYFDNPGIKAIPEQYIYDEMILDLRTFDPAAAHAKLTAPEGIRFGFFEGKIEDLKKSVAEVDESWVKYFNRPELTWCAVDTAEGNRVVSFCDVSDFGEHLLGGKTVKIGGPGCVGTVPDHRKRGIGLKMVLGATEILKNRGYDYSFIHYTGVGPWYAKLGYETIVRWNSKGIVGE